jgi:N-acyl homoserine lactone hydrolase
LHLADVTLPEGHPLAGRTCGVFAFLIRHPQCNVLVDTGVGADHPGIERLYRPVRRSLTDALAAVGLGPHDVAAVINTHLHFDHCGENGLFPHTPIHVQAEEYEAAREPFFTIPEWVDFPGASYELLRGETEVLPGVVLLPTPGHTPGHQSVLIESGEGRIVIAGQAAYSAEEYARANGAGDAEGAWSQELYLKSLSHLRGLEPREVYFSHDTAVWNAA